MKRIEKPHFYTKLLNGLVTNELVITKEDFDLWYDNLLENAVEVECQWHDNYKDNQFWSQKGAKHMTHRALLINIQPIKKESAEDVLREIVRAHQPSLTGETIIFDKELVKRAKAALEQGDA